MDGFIGRFEHCTNSITLTQIPLHQLTARTQLMAGAFRVLRVSCG